ncbi:MAG: tetratricopeptide repeat protein [Bryobacterales bacterium]|nr:tetratricopeptide repeat protein [Bryobacterales bacterium]
MVTRSLWFEASSQLVCAQTKLIDVVKICKKELFCPLPHSYSGFQIAGIEALPKVQAAAARALEIDEQLAEAHSALAIAKTNLEWDWQGAEREYRRAIELYPGHAAAHDWFGFHLALMGRSDEAVRELERAIELDPLSAAYWADLAEAHRLGRRYRAAIEVCEKAIATDPKHWLAYLILGAAHALNGDYPAALATLQKGRAIEYDILFRVVEAQTLARAGDIGGALQLARGLRELRAQGRTVNATFLAPIYAFVGDEDSAFQCLREALHDREPFIAFLKTDRFLIRYDQTPDSQIFFTR